MRTRLGLFVDKINFVGPEHSQALGRCWLWTASLDRDGYGYFRTDDGIEKAHRVAYKLFVGDLPDDVAVCHRCDTPPCVNFSHLFVGTQVDNLNDMHEKSRGAIGGRALDDDTVARIFELRDLGMTQVAIAGQLGISQGVVSKKLAHRAS